MSGSVQITGAPTTPGPNGAVPVRRELSELQKTSPDQFNVFVLGMRALQSTDEEQLTSYYQVAGIHGMPFREWDGVPSRSDWSSTQGFGGYCTHSSVLFAPWHRPYLALFEQSLYQAVQDMAQRFPESMRQRYVDAARDFRLPYFDWAASPGFPDAIGSATVSVVDVDGMTKDIDNPLHSFSFHPLNPERGDFDQQWSQHQATVRYPTSNKGTTSRDDRIGPILKNENASLRTNVSTLLLSYDTFDAFSSNQWDSSVGRNAFGSLEDVHNEIHDKTGGGGHMSSLEVSAFDPLFWLHHCNIDRLWALWQDLHPDSFIEPQEAPISTFGVKKGETQSQDSPLAPFWNRTGTEFWTSAQVKDSTTFGYAYPETQKWNYPSVGEYQQALKQTVVLMYGANVLSNFAANIQPKPSKQAAPAPAVQNGGQKQDGAAGGQKVMAAAANPVANPVAKPAASNPSTNPSTAPTTNPAGNQPHSHPSNGIPESLAHLAPNNTYTDWVVNVRAQKHGLGQSYRILVFLGDISPNPDDWDTEYNCVGRVSVLARNSTTQCGKCRDDMHNELMISGTVPLTSALLQDIVAGEVASLRGEDVVPHLRRELKWRAMLFTGEEVDVNSIPALRVSVVSTQVTIGEDGLPIYSGEAVSHPEITSGVPGGLDEGEE